MRKLLITTTLAAFTAAAALGAGTLSASADPWYPGWHRGGWHHHGWDRGYGRGYYRGGWHDRGWRHHDNGGAIAAGIGGLALGALIGGAVASPRYEPDYYYGRPVPVQRVYPLHRVRPGYRSVSAEHVAACARHYRTYNPSTDTFTGNDGRAHYCRY